MEQHGTIFVVSYFLTINQKEIEHQKNTPQETTSQNVGKSQDDLAQASTGQPKQQQVQDDAPAGREPKDLREEQADAAQERTRESGE